MPTTPPVSRPTNDTIVLVLPLESPLYGHAAEAVRAGFLAAANAAGSGARARVVGHGDDGVLPAFSSAADSGAALLVGPLTRDDLKTVLAFAMARPRTLALNQPDDGSALPDDAYALALSVESDAALLARRARDDGARTITAVTSDAPLQRRFKAAFAAAWERAGGSTLRDYRFDTNPEVLGLLRRELSARPADATLLCVAAGEAALVRSFLPPGRVYASSQVADGLSTQTRDPEIEQWDGKRAGLEGAKERYGADAAYTHLELNSKLSDLIANVDELHYALGLDAFAIAELLASPIPPDRIEIDGATGHLSLMPTRVFARDGRIMVIHDGQSALDTATQ